MAACHHTFGNVEEFRQLHVVESGGSALAERRDERARESGAVDIASHAYHRGRIKHSVDAGLGVVAHDKATELQVGTLETVRGIIPHTHFRVVILKI